MSYEWLERTSLLLGDEKLKKLQNANVLVVGLGGVGAYAAEMIARSGVGRMTIADADTVSPTNINRQLIALHSTIGKEKSELMADRLRDIMQGGSNTIIAIEKDKELGKDGTIWVAPCLETSSSAYCKLVVEIVAE